MPGLDESHLRLQVSGLVAHVGLEPGRAAHLLGEVARRDVVGLHDPRAVGDVADRRGGGVVGGHGEPDLVGHEVDAVQARQVRGRVVRVLLGDDEVEVARPGLPQRGLGLALRDRDAQARVVAGEALEGRGQQREGRRLEHGETHGAGGLAQRRGEVGLRLLEPSDHRLGVLDQDRRLRGELHPAPDLAQQLDAHLPLELRELLRHRRRALVQCLGDGRERATRIELEQESQTADVEHGRS